MIRIKALVFILILQQAGATTPDPEVCRHLLTGKTTRAAQIMKFARRAALLTTIAQVAVVLPELTQLPGYFSSREAIRQTNDELERAPGRSIELNELYLRNLKDQLLREETRLQKAIEAGRTATSPDGRIISELEEELTALRAQYPALFETKPN